MPLQFSEQEYKFIGFYVLRNLLEFAEGKTQIKDSALLLELKNILETQYKDGITAIPEAYIDESDIFTGIFEDAVNPGLTKKYSFTVNPNAETRNIQYKMVNANEASNYNEITEFSEQEWIDFARTKMFGGSKQKKNCKPGNTSCGFTCIAGGKTCWQDMSPNARKKAKSLAAKTKKGQVKPATSKEKTSQTKASPEAIALTDAFIASKEKNGREVIRDLNKLFIKNDLVAGKGSDYVQERLQKIYENHPADVKAIISKYNKALTKEEVDQVAIAIIKAKTSGNDRDNGKSQVLIARYDLDSDSFSKEMDTDFFKNHKDYISKAFEEGLKKNK